MAVPMGGGCWLLVGGVLTSLSLVVKASVSRADTGSAMPWSCREEIQS